MIIIKNTHQFNKLFDYIPSKTKTIRATSPASLPLGACASEKKFKALLVDIGLMRSLNDLPATVEYTKNNLLSIYNGALVEQFTGQEFISSGKENLYY